RRGSASGLFCLSSDGRSIAAQVLAPVRRRSPTAMNSVVSYLPSAAPQQGVEAEIQRVFERQRETALRLRSSTRQERKAKIQKLRDAVIAHSEEFIKAGYADFRKPPAEVELTEILSVVSEAN